MRILFALSLAALALQQKDPAPVPGWLSDLPAGFEEARKTGKPLMVVFR